MTFDNLIQLGFSEREIARIEELSNLYTATREQQNEFIIYALSIVKHDAFDRVLTLGQRIFFSAIAFSSIF